MVFIEIIIVGLFFLLIYFWFKNKLWQMKFEQRIKDWQVKNEKIIREDAILRSARTLSGKTLERLIPFLDRFPYDPHDIRWIGDPIDLVIFNSHSKDNSNNIIFCEVKSGNSKLTKRQSDIKKLIENKRVEWLEFRT